LFAAKRAWHDAEVMNPFAHFILTRFNVPLKSVPASAPSGLDEAWLARRFHLFERVCLPSVDQQTEGAFQWLVFMDWATPVAFKEKMAALCVHYDCLRPVYCSQFDEATALAEIRRREAPEKVRITTGLDNDDALHPRMVEHVQELARARLGAVDLAKGFFISFPLGCCECQGRFYLVRDKANPFVSFVSAPECPATVVGADPANLGKLAPVVYRSARPLWCQTIHPDNVSNHRRGLYWPGGRQSAFAYLGNQPAAASDG